MQGIAKRRHGNAAWRKPRANACFGNRGMRDSSARVRQEKKRDYGSGNQKRREEDPGRQRHSAGRHHDRGHHRAHHVREDSHSDSRIPQPVGHHDLLQRLCVRAMGRRHHRRAWPGIVRPYFRISAMGRLHLHHRRRPGGAGRIADQNIQAGEHRRRLARRGHLEGVRLLHRRRHPLRFRPRLG